MQQYIINVVPDEKGSYELHRITCPRAPEYFDAHPVGEHESYDIAFDMAKRIFGSITKCEHCSK